MIGGQTVDLMSYRKKKRYRRLLCGYIPYLNNKWVWVGTADQHAFMRLVVDKPFVPLSWLTKISVLGPVGSRLSLGSKFIGLVVYCRTEL